MICPSVNNHEIDSIIQIDITSDNMFSIADILEMCEGSTDRSELVLMNGWLINRVKCTWSLFAFPTEQTT